MPQTSKKVGLAAALAMAMAIPAEGIRQVAYYDPPGILTVCYGTTGKDVVKGKVYTLDECKALLNRDMLQVVEAVNRCHPDAPANVLAAVSDAAYNIGERVACDRSYSSVARAMYDKQWDAACRNLLKFDKARIGGVLMTLPGLTKRRQAEMDLCLKDSV